MKIILAIILIISVYFSGCIDFNSQDNIFIKEWSTEPANVKSEEKFSLHTVISNPTKYDDEAYIQYAFDSSCFGSDKMNLLIPVGTIRAGETKKVYKDFIPRYEKSGENCQIQYFAKNPH